MSAASDSALPDGLLVAWYGDDYTGSAAVMEVLTFSGLPSVLFLDPPTPERVAAFAGYRAIGIAGVARSQSPDWMEENLPPAIEALRAMQAPVTHYKVCSTFDSSPTAGSIGKAYDLAAPRLAGIWTPLLVAAPEIGRYQAFGNLFASAGDGVHRLDRHPAMCCHPSTPMGEADVRRHLAAQTSASVGLVDIAALAGRDGGRVLAAQLEDGAEIVALDGLDEPTMAAAGKLIWEHRGERLLAIGSQGVEYALIAHWRATGLLSRDAEPAGVGSVTRMAAVSGSCAPQTTAQIAWAQGNGFEPIRLDASCAVDTAEWERETGDVLERARKALGDGKDPIVFTASGPDDPAIANFNTALETAGGDKAEVNARVGSGLGHILGGLIRDAGITRCAIVGGDTSGYGAQTLGIFALTALAPTVPGAALLRAHADDPVHDGLEIALKGGQMGAPDFFGQIKQGGLAVSQGEMKR